MANTWPRHTVLVIVNTAPVLYNPRPCHKRCPGRLRPVLHVHADHRICLTRLSRRPCSGRQSRHQPTGISGTNESQPKFRPSLGLRVTRILSFTASSIVETLVRQHECRHGAQPQTATDQIDLSALHVQLPAAKLSCGEAAAHPA